MQQVPMAPPLPPVPQPEAPQPKKGFPRWLLIVGGIVAALALIGAFAPKAPAASPKPAVVAAPSCVDVDGAITINQDAIAELNAGTTSIQSLDVDGAADHLDNAAADYIQIAGMFGDYPTVSGPAGSAGANMNRSADELRQMNVDAATNYLEAATSDIDEVTSNTEALVGEVTPC